MRMPKCSGILEWAGVEVIDVHQFATRAADHLTAYEHGQRRPENRAAQSRAAARIRDLRLECCWHDHRSRRRNQSSVCRSHGFGLDSLIEIFAPSIVI